MPKVNYCQLDGSSVEIEVPVGHSVMHAALSERVSGIYAECGGNLMCATCHVYVDEPWLPRLEPIGTDQEYLLEHTAAPRRSTSRLSCQIVMTEQLDGLQVTMPQTQT